MPADDDTFWRVEQHGAIVRLIRTPVPYTSAEQARDCHVQLLHRVLALDLDRARCGQLVDLRHGPLRTDPTFEEAIREPRARLFDGMGASAVLVQTLSGKLQLHRMERTDRVYRTFDDEDEALAYLTATLAGALQD